MMKKEKEKETRGLNVIILSIVVVICVSRFGYFLTIVLSCARGPGQMILCSTLDG